MKSTGKRITLAVTGSIAAYKAVELLRLLTRAGHDVHVVQTPSSLKFVGEMSFQALSGHPVAVDQFEASTDAFSHIELASADLMLVAPATADTIGKMAAGIADNLLLSTYLATQAPVVICPAMNERMWEHPAVKENLATLRRRGVAVIDPGTGELACGEEGAGRMAEPSDIAGHLEKLLSSALSTDPISKVDLKGVRILVTAGGTREPLDSVRYITNRSSGRMGFAMADAALDRGAEVTVIAANCTIARNPAIKYVDVTSSSDLQKAVEVEFERCDVLLMAAAVSDYKVSAGEATGKLEREGKNDLQLVPTSDIVSHLQGNGNGRLKVGFSAEYGEDNRERARSKLLEKGLGMIVFNDISRADIGFESNLNEITIMAPGREDIFVGKTTKRECAERILDQVVELLS
ncbi:MAG: bifunctional phosphopantothenoylcysteine decarboxylase/phosphopantothenate--cysteine ligase CoaBC [Actinobacteria bacterium]|nr:bifunctional phosphopantothenoylcysteine decarboxylase/phosphopantothenate--cysteine ligase CoaBC [Actinomycetota bacterium]